MDQLEFDENHAAGNTETDSPAYVPPLQLTEGQPPLSCWQRAYSLRRRGYARDSR